MTMQLLKNGDVIERVDQESVGSIRIAAATPFDEIQTSLLRQELKQKLVLLEFSNFADGRGFSLAKMLKRALPSTTALAATGAIIPDQVALAWQCGFDSIIVSDELWHRCGPGNWMA